MASRRSHGGLRGARDRGTVRDARRLRVRATCLALALCALVSACRAGGGDRPSHQPSPQGTRVGGASPTKGPCTVTRLLVSPCGAWWGIAPAELTGTPRPQALADFERKVGRTADIVHFYHRGDQVFPTPEEIAIARQPGRHRLLLLNWKPEMGRTWAQVAKGDPVVDAQIDKVAANIKATFPERFFLTIHHEPENDVRPQEGSGFTARDYRAMFRHVVQRLRADGVHNAVIAMTYIGIPKWGVQPWFDDLYPGDDVVDWLAYDPYAVASVDSFGELVNQVLPGYPEWPGFYKWAQRHVPDKPMMLAEWGVVEQGGDPSRKPAFFRGVAREIRSYPRFKALVYYDAPRTSLGDTRIDSTPAALGAFRDLGKLTYVNPPGP